MGGLSQGNLVINKKGNAVFSGHVSLDNNGGFTSIRKKIDFDALEGEKNLILRVKGDERRYQMRMKRNASDYHSYIQYFDTSNDWETIELPLEDFYPSFRGRKLDMDNFPSDQIAELSILIANYKEEDFELEIDYIALD